MRLAWFRKRPEALVALLVLLVVVGCIGYWAIWADSSPAWTGFGAYDEEAQGPRAKTLWDWMGLLIVPLAVAVGAAFIGYYQKKTELEVAKKERENERQIARDQQMQATLEAYYDRMTELLLEHNLRESEPDSEVRSIARARTIAVLKSFDGERCRQLFAFLTSSRLLSSHAPIVDLRRARLDSIDLMGANLEGIRLDGAFLHRTILAHANLTGADLTGAFLEEADLESAVLTYCMMMEANLRRAVLSGCKLKSAVIAAANLTEAQLAGADLTYTVATGANLTRASIRSARLHGIQLDNANLSGTDLSYSVLSDANLTLADLSAANLRCTDLSNAKFERTTLDAASLYSAKGWTFEQLELAGSFESTIMPDGVQLLSDVRIGPTFEQWKVEYIAKYGAEVKGNPAASPS